MNFYITTLNEIETEKDKEEQSKIIDILLSDAISWYSRIKWFNHLIPIFTQVYNIDNLWKKFMEIFG